MRNPIQHCGYCGFAELWAGLTKCRQGDTKQCSVLYVIDANNPNLLWDADVELLQSSHQSGGSDVVRADESIGVHFCH